MSFLVLAFLWALCPYQFLHVGPASVQALNLRLNITEECSVGVNLGSLLHQLYPSTASSSSAAHTQLQASNSQLRARPPNVSLVFLEDSSRFFALFELNESTLEVRTRARIDREALCGPGLSYRLPENLITTLIAADEQAGHTPSPADVSAGRSPSAYFGRKSKTGECLLEFQLMIRPVLALATLTIVVDDVNDWAPTFRPFLPIGSDVFVRNVRENSDLKTTCVELPPPIDLDAGSNAVREMRLVKSRDSARFGIRWKQPSVKFGDLCLYPLTALDREHQESYSLQIEALDGGAPQRSGVLNLTVVLTDANDNSPAFERERYTLSIEENTPPETFLIRVNASDTDVGENARLLYSLATDDFFATQHLGVGQEIDQPFRIDKDTGVLRFCHTQFCR